MFENIMCILIFLFAVVGIVQTVRFVAKWLLLPREGYRKLTVIPMKDHVENAELILRYEAQMRDCRKNCEFVVADYGMDDETAQICQRMATLGIIDRVVNEGELISDIKS